MGHWWLHGWAFSRSHDIDALNRNASTRRRYLRSDRKIVQISSNVVICDSQSIEMEWTAHKRLKESLTWISSEFPQEHSSQNATDLNIESERQKESGHAAVCECNALSVPVTVVDVCTGTTITITFTLLDTAMGFPFPVKGLFR